MKALEKYHPLLIFLLTLSSALSGKVDSTVSVVACALTFGYLIYSNHIENNKQPDIRQETQKQLDKMSSDIQVFQESQRVLVETKLDALKKDTDSVKQRVEAVVSLKTTPVNNLQF